VRNIKWQLHFRELEVLLVLLVVSSISVTVQATELNSESPQNGIIKACTSQRIDLSAPQLTDSDLEALTHCSSEVIPQLLEALKAKDWRVKAIATHRLGLFGTKAQSAIPALINLMKDENADVRFTAAQALGKINSEQAVSPLIKALQDKDKNVRFAATNSLLQLGSKMQQDNLITFVRFLANENQRPFYRQFTIVDASKPESRSAIPAYIEALGNSNWFIRNHAANILTKLRVDPTPVAWVGTITPNGYTRGAFTNTFLRENSDIFIEIIKSSKDAEIRKQAGQVLGMLKDKKAIPSLINALQNEIDLDTAKEIVKALGRIGAEEAVPAILTTWQKASSRQPDNIYAFREQIVKTLEQIGSQEAIEGLIAAFPKEKMSFIASTTIRKIVKGDTTPEESISLLKDILQGGDINAIIRIIDPPELVIGNSAYSSALKTSLKQLGIEKVVSILKPILLREAENEYDPAPSSNRLAASKALSVFGPDAVPVIVTSFSEGETFAVFIDVLTMDDVDKDIPTQALANNVLSQVGTKIIPALIAILRNPKSAYRSNAADALGKVRTEKAVPFLIEALTSEDENLKVSAIAALGQIGSAEAIPALTNTLKDKENFIRWWSAIALGRIGSAKATPYLIEALQQDSDESVRKYIAEELGQIGSPEAVPVLIKSLKDKSYFVREAVAEALGKIKAQAAIPALIESLKDKNWTVRLKAATALKSIGTRVVPPLITVLNSNRDNSSAIQTVLKDKNADHRRSVAYVLWQMGSFANQASNDLVAVAKNENDNLYVRWMAATAVENMGQDMDRFFTDNNLANPKTLTPTQCPNDLYNPEFDLKAYIADFYEEYTVDMNELIYAGRCIYGDSPQAGGTTYGFYERLKALLNRR
jgi:HEAT repeat protein